MSRQPIVARAGRDERHLVWLLGVTVLAFFIWFTPLGYPFRLYATAIHELGHAVAAIVTGGTVLSFIVFANGAGEVRAAGGSTIALASGGYVGSALFSALLIVLSGRTALRRPLLYALGLAFLVAPLLWTRHLFGFASMIAMAAALIAIAYYAPTWGVGLTVYLLAVLNTFYAFDDLVDLLVPAALGHAAQDARLLASATFIPAIVWTIVWLGLSTTVLFFAVRSQLRG